jgi:uncharacterized protein YbjQ (UPF0145 family)
MPFWESAAQKSVQAAQAATRAALELGGIPPEARHRLEMQRKSDSRFFTSDLTCNEFLLSQAAGYESIGLVMGTSFYKVSFWGYFGGYQTSTGELAALSHAQLAARELAIDRLRQEAAILGAHGVIGVRLQMGSYDWSNRTVEFTAIGTAIRINDRQADLHPFTSDLSGQEFWQLHQAGYYPRGIVLGICSYYIHTDWQTQNLTRGGFFGRGSGQNQEIVQYTQGFNLARNIAMQRLSADIHQHQAEGAVGMHIDMGIEEIEYEVNNTKYHDLLAHFVGLGTSIVRDAQPIETTRKPPLLYYDLATGKADQIQVE